MAQHVESGGGDGRLWISPQRSRQSHPVALRRDLLLKHSARGTATACTGSSTSPNSSWAADCWLLTSGVNRAGSFTASRGHWLSWCMLSKPVLWRMRPRQRNRSASVASPGWRASLLGLATAPCRQSRRTRVRLWMTRAPPPAQLRSAADPLALATNDDEPSRLQHRSHDLSGGRLAARRGPLLRFPPVPDIHDRR